MRMKKTGMLILGCMAVILAAGCAKKESAKKEDAQKEAEEQVEPFTYTNGQPLDLWESKETMPYYDAEVTEQSVTAITPYVIDAEDSGCVIICPGGGYEHLAVEKEGSKPAEALNENGISAFVLEYRVAPYTYKAMLSDVCRAVRFVRYPIVK